MSRANQQGLMQPAFRPSAMKHDVPRGEVKSVTNQRVGLPLVSICCATYNHERYLAQTLESFLMQKVSFPIEIIIRDDCSTDRTPQIVRDYAERFPRLVRVIASDANVGVSRNALRIRAAARGKYIALCEGDDYWTDPQKLQKQVSFLEANPEFVMCGHRVRNVDASGNLLERQVFTGDDCPEVFTLEHVLLGTPFHMNSWVFRVDALRSIPQDKMDIVLRLPAHDDPLLVLLLARGKGCCFRERMGVYRIHSSSYWSSRSELDCRFALLQFYYSLPALREGEPGCVGSDAVMPYVRRGQKWVARAAGSNPLAALKLLRKMKKCVLVPQGRIPGMSLQLALQIAGGIARHPKALGGRVLRSTGLR
jgi:glycosyltransferase involved in cell wall biosynthesis